MGILERIKEIEHEIARTQKNKATEYHLGLLRAKLARLRTELMGVGSSSKENGEGFDVKITGDARVSLIGFPSVGKSSLLSTVTKTKSEAASYEFTTLTAIPGIIEYNDANIQLLDLPGIIEGASKGKGRGKQVIAAARTSDCIVMMLDATKADIQRKLLTAELFEVGLRLNARKPNIEIRKKKTGGVSLNSMVQLSHCSLEFVRDTLKLYKIHNADVLMREDCTQDEFIDVVEGNRVYLPCLYVCNKIDCISLDQVDRLAHKPHHVVVSVNEKWNLDYLIEKIWEYLAFVRVYTKPRGEKPDFSGPLIMKTGSRVEQVCQCIHKDMAKNFKYALVWGTSAKHQPQRVGLVHEVADEDVVQIMIKGSKE